MSLSAIFQLYHEGWPFKRGTIVFLVLYKPITNTTWVRAQLCNLQKRCTRLAAASDKAYQLLVHGNSLSRPGPSSKKELASKIKVFSTDSKFVLWFKVSRDIFNLDEDVIFGIVYMPPENT
jgi:hypothetical protein